MEETNVLSELGEWKDCIGYPLYSISSTGVFMNKRTLKILKHFRHKDSDESSVTLYISGKSGHVLSVDGLLKTSLGPDATLPEVVYKNDKTTELAPAEKPTTELAPPKTPTTRKRPTKTETIRSFSCKRKRRPILGYAIAFFFFCSYW